MGKCFSLLLNPEVEQDEEEDDDNDARPVAPKASPLPRQRPAPAPGQAPGEFPRFGAVITIRTSLTKLVIYFGDNLICNLGPPWAFRKALALQLAGMLISTYTHMLVSIYYVMPTPHKVSANLAASCLRRAGS